MSIEDSDAPLKIVEAGRRRVALRMRAAVAGQVDAHPELGEVDPDELDSLVDEATDRAGAAVWRIALAEGAADEFGVPLSEALHHPALTSAERLIGAGADADADAPTPGPTPTPVSEPTPSPEPGPPAQPTETAAAQPPQAVRVAAVHQSGIDALEAGDKDLELRFSDAGLDVLRRSSGVAIGRLEWGDITSVEVEENRKGIGRKRSQALHVRTSRGQARFELPGLSEEESAEHLEPLLSRLRASGQLADG